jgi:TBC1 domain family member 5
LNIPADVPEAPQRLQHRRSPSAQRSRFGGQSQHSLSASEHSNMSIAETIARGVMERGESLGINKTVMNAVSELKVNSVSKIWWLG